MQRQLQQRDSRGPFPNGAPGVHPAHPGQVTETVRRASLRRRWSISRSKRCSGVSGGFFGFHDFGISAGFLGARGTTNGTRAKSSGSGMVLIRFCEPKDYEMNRIARLGTSRVSPGCKVIHPGRLGSKVAVATSMRYRLGVSPTTKQGDSVRPAQLSTQTTAALFAFTFSVMVMTRWSWPRPWDPVSSAAILRRRPRPRRQELDKPSRHVQRRRRRTTRIPRHESNTAMSFHHIHRTGHPPANKHRDSRQEIGGRLQW